jgi:uncharacterized protein YjbI with pentapeptide repeats
VSAGHDIRDSSIIIGYTAEQVADLIRASTAQLDMDYQPQDVARALSSLYQDTFNACLQAHNYPVTVQVTSEVATAFDLTFFDPNFPMAHPLFTQLLDHVKQRVVATTKREDVTQQLDEQVRNAFGTTFNRLRTRAPNTYPGVSQYVELLLKGYETTEGQVIAHMNTILHALAHEPLPIDPAVTLWQIYVTPRAHYQEPQTPGMAREAATPEVENLIDSLLKTLGNSRAPILLHGQPGHGKSSTVRMLTHALVTHERVTRHPQRMQILLYELKDLGQLNRHELQILAGRTPFLQGESFFQGKRTLLILDGLDERQITDGSDSALHDFLRHLCALAERINQRDDASRLQLLFTGRTQFVHQVQNAFPPMYHQYEILDFTPTQVASWLNKYCALKEVHPPLTVADLEAKHLGDLIGQPILLTMTTQMLVDDQGRQLLSALPAGPVSRGAIYRTIITWTYRKRWQAYPNSAALPDEATYTRFLRAVAITLFRQGQESIKVHELTTALHQHRELYGLENLQHKTAQEIEDICQRIAVSFFFKGLEANVVSFIHKTIKDYLTVEAWVSLLRDLTAHFNPQRPGHSSGAMAPDLYFLFGSQAFVPEDHRAFLHDILTMDEADVQRLFESLAVVFKGVQRHAYLGDYGSKLSPDPVQTEAHLCAMLLQLLTSIFQVCSDEERRAIAPEGVLRLFEEPDGLYKCLHLLNATDVTRWYRQTFNLSLLDLQEANLREADLFGANLGRANLREADLGGANLGKAYLRGADLREANLGRAALGRANLGGANLGGANLGRADLGGANLGGAALGGAALGRANLREANLFGANLRDADLREANLGGANLGRAALGRADLDRANLFGADLGEANLFGADLRGANLRGANLGEANLFGADLREANLRDANLRDANLGRADLGRADLRGANLGKADLGEANLFGANLGKADLGKANLFGAGLGGADLRGADLREANLREADLGGVDLREANLREADLGGADLRGADLRGADLRGADLRGADITTNQLTQLFSLEEAIMPNGSKYPGKASQQGDEV